MGSGPSRVGIEELRAWNSLGRRSAPYVALPKVFLPRPTWPAIGDKLQFPAGNLRRLPKGSGPEFPIWPLASFEVSMPEWRNCPGRWTQNPVTARS
jgi:hypothetical protein